MSEIDKPVTVQMSQIDKLVQSVKLTNWFKCEMNEQVQMSEIDKLVQMSQNNKMVEITRIVKLVKFKLVQVT